MDHLNDKDIAITIALDTPIGVFEARLVRVSPTVCKEANAVSTQVASISLEALQGWSQSSESARNNLQAIFAGLKLGEPMSEWAAEALENCGPPLESDLDFLGKATTELESTAAYWACKLIGRLGPRSSALQDSLATVLLSEQAGFPTRQQAALALTSIGNPTHATRRALEQAAKSTDPRLARISQQALGSES